MKVDPSDTYQIIILLILLALSAFFSSNETALMSVNKIRLRSLADDGNKRAAMALDILENQMPKLLSAILIGNNIVNISASSLATTLAYSFGGYMVSIVTMILTVLILIFGEITPKNYATINAEKITLRYIPVFKFLMTIMTPVIFIINLFSRGVMRLMRVDPDAASKAMTEEELRTIVDVSHEDGVIESDEKEMIYNVFDLGDATAKDIMVPRVHVTFADVESTYDELIEIFREDKFTRLPVYKDSQNNIVGIINMKDLLLYDKNEEFVIDHFLRKPHFTYETKSISDLLVEMKDSTFNIAIVLDEYGDMAGLITLEDILEEIVGNIMDEYDEDQEHIKNRGKDEYVMEGSTPLEEVEELLDITFDEEEFETLNGFLISKLDRIPEPDEQFDVDYKGYNFKILSVVKKMIGSVLVTKLPEEKKDADVEDGQSVLEEKRK